MNIVIKIAVAIVTFSVTYYIANKAVSFIRTNKSTNRLLEANQKTLETNKAHTFNI